LKLKSNEYGDVDDDVAAMMVLNLVDFVVVDEYGDVEKEECFLLIDDFVEKEEYSGVESGKF
jgi:hypothetical protein